LQKIFGQISVEELLFLFVFVVDVIGPNISTETMMLSVFGGLLCFDSTSDLGLSFEEPDLDDIFLEVDFSGHVQ
jgi:hypothetical protein